MNEFPSQPMTETQPRLVNGEFYAKRDKIFRAPIETKTDSGTRVSVGFPVCHVSDYVDPENLVECLNASREVDGLKARIEELECNEKAHEKFAGSLSRTVREQATRIEALETWQRARLETGDMDVKRIEELEGALREIQNIGCKITDPKNSYGLQMGNIATAALEAKHD